MVNTRLHSPFLFWYYYLVLKYQTFYFNVLLVLVCVHMYDYGHMYTMACMWMSEDNFFSIFYFYLVSSVKNSGHQAWQPLPLPVEPPCWTSAVLCDADFLIHSKLTHPSKINKDFKEFKVSTSLWAG